jgi:hypothetical protein
MDIFIIKDLLHSYFNNKFSTLESRRLISATFSNPKNRFLMNKNYWDIIIKEVDPDDPKLDLYHQFFLQLQSESQILNIKSNTDFEKEFAKSLETIISDYKKDAEIEDLIFVILGKDEHTDVKNSNYAVLSKIKKPNKHWIYFQIASLNPNTLTVRYYDFKTNKEIKSFLESLYNLVNKPKIAWIFDRYRNVEHFCFDALVGKVKFHYMTLNFDKFENQTVVNTISKKLKSSIVFSAHGSKIHERRLILGNLIVEVDDDFLNITADRNTWKMDICCCGHTSQELLKKQAFFKRVN